MEPAKQQRRCPKCNELYSAGATACTTCGAELVRRCPNCGAVRAWNVATCPRCVTSADDVSLFTDLFRRVRTGTLADRYRIQDTLYTGRVTTVYRASDVQDPSRLYAIKELSPLSLIRAEERHEAVASLARSIERWSRLAHPGLARVVNHFTDQERQYVVFEYAPGWSGERIITEPGVRTTAELARNWGAQLCDLLSYLHGQREPVFVPFLAPSHIVVSQEGVVRLVGLGLGRAYSPALYGPHGSVPGYGAPELATQVPDARSDLFSLGRLLYALLVGALLEKGQSRALPLVQAAPSTPAQLVQALARAANRRRERRYDSAAQMREALWDAVRGDPLPIPNWYAMARAESGDAPTPPQIAQGERVNMEALGFDRDPRFGRPAEPKAAAPAPRARSLARLSVDPTEIAVREVPSQGVKRLVLTIRNSGEEDLTFHLVTAVEWLRASDREVTLAPGKQARAILSLDVTRLPSGVTYEPRALAVDSNVGRRWIAVRADIPTAPSLEMDQSQLDLGRMDDDSERSASLVIRNGGRQPLAGQVASRVAWLHVSPAEFRVAPGGQVEVQARIAPAKLPNGPQQVQDALVVDSNGGQARVAVAAWRPRPRLDLSVSQIDLGRVASGQVVERELAVRNAGDGVLQGSARSLVPWLQVYPDRWTCEPGDVARLGIVCDCAGLADGPIHVPQALRIQTNGGNASLALDIQISAPRMVVETTMLELGRVLHGDRAQSEVLLRNAGTADLEALVQPAVDWVQAGDERIICPPGESRRIPISVETGAFGRGARLDEPTALRIIAGATIVAVGARLTVIRPSLSIEPESVDFGYVDPAQPTQQTVILRNEGVGALAWNVQTDAEWVEIAPRSGVCPEGDQVALSLTAYALALEAGRREAAGILIVNSDGGRIKLPLRLALAAPRLEIDRSFVDLGVSVNRRNVEASVRLFNRGLGLLRGTVISDKLWLVTDRASFECEMGHSIELGVRTDMSEFPDLLDEDRGVIRIESNGGVVEIDTRVQTQSVAELAQPQAVTLDAGEGDRAPQGRLTLNNTGLATARVTLKPGNPALTASRDQVEIKAGKSVRITLQWQGNLPTDQGETYIIVQMGDTTLQVPVYMSRNRP